MNNPDQVLFSPLPEKAYEIIAADAPWRYTFTKVKAWGIDVHYPTLTPEQIASLNVPRITATNAVLFMWATSPKLTEALFVMKRWGFDYKTSMIWHKQPGLGMGYRVRVDHEFLLIGTHGKPPVPAVPNRPASVVKHPRGKHSEKPELFYSIIEAMHPESTRIELFARGNPRPGWDKWGAEIK